MCPLFCAACRDSDFSASGEEEAMSDVYSSDEDEQEDPKDYHKGQKTQQ